MDKDEITEENSVADQLLTGYGFIDEETMSAIVRKCVRIEIGERFENICRDQFEPPTFEKMKALILEEVQAHFDEKVVPAVERTYPEIGDEDLDAELDRLEKKYLNSLKKEIAVACRTAMEEIVNQVNELKRELKTLKKKYTF